MGKSIGGSGRSGRRRKDKDRQIGRDVIKPEAEKKAT